MSGVKLVGLRRYCQCGREEYDKVHAAPRHSCKFTLARSALAVACSCGQEHDVSHVQIKRGERVRCGCGAVINPRSMREVGHAGSRA